MKSPNTNQEINFLRFNSYKYKLYDTNENVLNGVYKITEAFDGSNLVVSWNYSTVFSSTFPLPIGTPTYT